MIPRKCVCGSSLEERQVTDGTFKCKGCDGTLYAGDRLWRCCGSCAANNFGYKRSGSGNYRGAHYCGSCINVTSEKSWSCCGYSEGNSGCKRDSTDKWDYCGNTSSYAEGCQRRCSNCKLSDDWSNNCGCYRRYRCCGGNQGSVGCQTIYQCCATDINSMEGKRGCSYKCCKKSIGSDPCRNQCKKCGTQWGEPKDIQHDVFGCSYGRDAIHQFAE